MADVEAGSAVDATGTAPGTCRERPLTGTAVGPVLACGAGRGDGESGDAGRDDERLVRARADGPGHRRRRGRAGGGQHQRRPGSTAMASNMPARRATRTPT
ncbi:hypothetical protein [Streptomyces sp. NPDC001410]|uniref:hypothetical protein n=1 Tax=Streptomyces sp. NPDC001410 TaxID=3364574 RepID=UPI00369BDF25